MYEVQDEPLGSPRVFKKAQGILGAPAGLFTI